MNVFRRIFQVSFLAAAITVGLRHALGISRITVETYCPFGGLEGLLSLFTNQQFTCATGERNLILFIALLILTFLCRRVFCSWICPVGTVSEGILWISRKLGFGKSKSKAGNGTLLPRKWDSLLRWLRLPILISILLLTFKTGELIFRGVDPYYILFSFHGHDVMWWSYIVLGIILISIFIIPMAWCRYLCPLGGSLWPVSKLGILRLKRTSACIDCGKCDQACPWGVEVSKADSVTSGECTLCLECTKQCPVDGALELQTPGIGKSFKTQSWIVPLLIIICIYAGVKASEMIRIPSAELQVSEKIIGTKSVRAVFIVDGVTCRDTAISAMSNLKSVDGVYSATAYASHNRVDVEFDPARVTVQQVAIAFGEPVFMEDTGEILFNLYRVVELNGKPFTASENQ